MTLNLRKCFETRWIVSRLGLGVSAVFCLTVAAGCFRVGLPEYFCDVPSTAPAAAALQPYRARLLDAVEKKAPIGVVVTADEDTETRDRSFGHQYLLGAFPFTRVFSQHGVSTAGEEVAARLLLDQGYRVVFVPGRLLDATLLEFPASLIVAPRARVRVNAFDLLVVRLAAVSGELECDFYSPSSLSFVRSAKVPVEENEYRKQAHAPVLADLLERSLRTGISACLRQAPSAREARLLPSTNEGTSGGALPTWIYPPEFSRPPAPAVGEKIAGSYGFASVPIFEYAKLLRLVQRGIGQAFEQRERPFVSSLSREPVSPPVHALRIRVDCLGIDDDGTMKSCFTLTGESAGKPGRTVKCDVEMPLLNDVDGALAVALELSAAQAAAYFLGAEGSPAAKTRCG